MKITYYGNSFFGIMMSFGTMVFNPIINNDSSTKSMPVDFEDLSGILISPGRNYKIEDAITISKTTGAVIISVAEIARFCESRGAKIHSMHIGGKHKFPFGVVRLTQATQGSSVEVANVNSFYGGLSCGFLINLDGFCLYYAGQTALFGDMRLIGNYHPIDVAILPLGDDVMEPEDVVIACELLKPKMVIPMYNNASPQIDQDIRKFICLLNKTSIQVQVRVMYPGEYFCT